MDTFTDIQLSRQLVITVFLGLVALALFGFFMVLAWQETLRDWRRWRSKDKNSKRKRPPPALS